jgi:hypothetical protein
VSAHGHAFFVVRVRLSRQVEFWDNYLIFRHFAGIRDEDPGCALGRKVRSILFIFKYQLLMEDVS